MKITCQSCQAKYTIADEKVVGKVVKIRCKKCQETIVVNGMDAGVGGDAGVPAGDAEWTVNVADGDQRNMSVGALVDAFNQGVVHEETYCWRDGMEDWLPIREIDELYRAVAAGRAPMLSSPNFETSPAGLGSGTNGHHANGTNGNGAHAGNGAATSMFGGGDLGGDIGFGAEPAPVAARRAGGRAGGDLFGAANAAAEGSVETANQEPEKLTGQRNENSVLFSLAALSEPGPTSGVKSPMSNRDAGGPAVSASSSTTATTDGSGLIDIRALSASMSNPSTSADDKKANVDDIMNLGGGGAFGALAAPILAPASVDVSGSINPGAPEHAKKGNNMMLFAVLGAGGMIAAAIVFVTMMNKPVTPPQGTGDPMANRGMPTATAGGGTDTTSPTGTPIGGDPGQVIPSGSSSARSPGAGAATTAKAGTPNPGPGGAVANPGTTGVKDPPKTNDTPKAADPPPKQETLEERMAREAGKSSGAAKTNDSPAGNVAFDRGAAQAALSSVNVSSCKKPDGPTGSGHVVVTFGADGNVVSAVVDAPPFSGTPVGGCVAGRFRGAHVPAFSGSPVKVGKSFSIN